MKKHISLVMSYPFKPELAAGNRMISLVNAAREKGYQVTIYSLKDDSLKQKENDGHHCIEPVQQLFNGFVGRAIKEICFAKRIFRELRRKDHQVVWVSIPSMFLFFLAPKNFAVFTHLDVRDLTWEYLKDDRPIERFAKKIFQFLARRKVSAFKSVSVTNPTEFSYMCNQLGFAESKVKLVPNGVSREQFSKLSQIQKCKKDTKTPIVISYLGNIGIPQNLCIFVDAALRLPKVIFNVVGAGENLKVVEDYAKKKGVSNVNFLGSLSWVDLFEIYTDSEILYAQLKKEFEGAVPSKLYEYLSTGKFIIYGGSGEALNLLENFDNFLTISPDNPRKLVEAIELVIREKLYEKNSDKNKKKIRDSFIREDHLGSCLDNIYEKQFLSG